MPNCRGAYYHKHRQKRWITPGFLALYSPQAFLVSTFEVGKVSLQFD